MLQWNPRKVKEVWELDPYVHGLRYTMQRMRKEQILIDNRSTFSPLPSPSLLFSLLLSPLFPSLLLSSQ